MTDRKYNVLFICVGNSARSIFAESLLRSLGGDRFNAYSAGVRPSSELNPFAVQVLNDKGHDVSVLRAKTLSSSLGRTRRSSILSLPFAIRRPPKSAPCGRDSPLAAIGV